MMDKIKGNAAGKGLSRLNIVLYLSVALFLATLISGFLFEALIPLINFCFGKHIAHWDFENWKLVVFVVSGLFSLGTLIWRGQIGAMQAEEQIKQGERTERQLRHTEQQLQNTAEQIRLSREMLAETQTNNLAKLFTDAAKLLSEGGTMAEQAAGLSLLEVVAFGAEGRFALAVIRSLREFIYSRIGGAAENPILRPIPLWGDKHYEIIAEALVLIERICANLSEKTEKPAQCVDMSGISISGFSPFGSGAEAHFRHQPFRCLSGLSYSGIEFSEQNFAAVPAAYYQSCLFLDCRIVAKMKIGGGCLIKSANPSALKSRIAGLTLCDSYHGRFFAGETYPLPPQKNRNRSAAAKTPPGAEKQIIIENSLFEASVILPETDEYAGKIIIRNCFYEAGGGHKTAPERFEKRGIKPCNFSDKTVAPAAEKSALASGSAV